MDALKAGRYIMKTQAKLIYFNGIVQGVGFRPFVFKLAEELGIRGWVNNSSHGVTIHAEGQNLDLFYNRLMIESPPLAKIVTARSVGAELKNYATFEIVQSLSLIHISEPTRLGMISYAVFCLKKKKKQR